MNLVMQGIDLILSLLLLLLLLRIAIYHVRLLIDPFRNPIFLITEPILRPLRRVLPRLRTDYALYLAVALIVIGRGMVWGLVTNQWLIGIRVSFSSFADLLLSLIVGSFVIYVVLPRYTGGWVAEFLQAFSELFLRFIPFGNGKARVAPATLLMVLLHAAATYFIKPEQAVQFAYDSPVSVVLVHYFLSALVLTSVLRFMTIIVVIGALLTWVNPDPTNPIVQLIWGLSYPINAPFRKLLPPLGGLDFSPMIAIFALYAATALYAALLTRIIYALAS